jgi:hypothetical protein
MQVGFQVEMSDTLQLVGELPNAQPLRNCSTSVRHTSARRCGCVDSRYAKPFHRNTPNGSWGIVQVQPTTHTGEKPDAPRIQWLPLFEFIRGASQSCAIVACRLGLNDPPTAVGGIRVE